jgi:hypothetical protein
MTTETETKKTTTRYALEWPWGRNMTTTHQVRRPHALGTREVVVPAARLYRFATLAEARRWVNASALRELLSDASPRARAWAFAALRETSGTMVRWDEDGAYAGRWER